MGVRLSLRVRGTGTGRTCRVPANPGDSQPGPLGRAGEDTGTAAPSKQQCALSSVVELLSYKQLAGGSNPSVRTGNLTHQLAGMGGYRPRSLLGADGIGSLPHLTTQCALGVVVAQQLPTLLVRVRFLESVRDNFICFRSLVRSKAPGCQPGERQFESGRERVVERSH